MIPAAIEASSIWRCVRLETSPRLTRLNVPLPRAGGGDTEPEEIAFFVDRGAVYGNFHAVKVAVGKTGLFDGMT